MRLFHGSNTEIRTIDFSKCKPYKDFGQGFYLTALKDQADKMAKRVTRIYGGFPCITEFEFDESVWKDAALSCRLFTAPNIEWAMFVIHNRSRSYTDLANTECNLDCKYDLVAGPVVNDDLALLFRQFEGGLIDADALIHEMKYKKLTNQYSFHFEKAVRYLQKAGVQYE